MANITDKKALNYLSYLTNTIPQQRLFIPIIDFPMLIRYYLVNTSESRELMTNETEENELFDLKLTGNGVTIDRQITASKAAQITRLVLGGGEDTSIGPQHTGMSMQDGGSANGPLSLREFLDEANALRKQDQIVAIGQYMAIHETKSTFTRDDVRTRFSLAQEPMPANFTRDFSKALKSGMIAHAHGDAKSFYITKSGVVAVRNKFGEKN